jgi:hypothetical protein
MSSYSIHAFRRLPALLFALSILISGCGSGDSSNSSIPASKNPKALLSALKVFDLAGNALNPFDAIDAIDAKAFVFVFISTDCPISNRYAPEIRRVEEEFVRAGVRFWLVYADTDTSADAIRKHIRDYRLPNPVLRDPRHSLVHLAQARVTPEAAVFLPGGRLVYHGRIDNRYADLGKERPEATQHDLEDVVKAILQARPVPYPTAKAVGCYIPEPK